MYYIKIASLVPKNCEHGRDRIAVRRGEEVASAERMSVNRHLASPHDAPEEELKRASARDQLAFVVTEAEFTLIDLAKLPQPEFRRVKALFNEMVVRAKAGSALDRAFAFNHLENAILRLYAALHGSSGADEAFRERIGQYIRGNLTSNLSIGTLSAVFGLSPSHFAHRFSSAFGVSPQVYIESCRLEYAKRLLETKNMPIKEIALDAGFADPLYFSKCFHRAFGVTPSSITGFPCAES